MAIFLVALLILAVGASMLYAGTTGKIAGKISDAESHEPLPGANVVIQGTTLGAVSDLDGNYIILNVPPGVYTVVVSMIGYRQVKYENVRVSIDLTTRVNAALQATALELGEVTIVAERTLVTRDMTSSLATTTAEQIQSLPVNNMQQVLRLNAGIIESDGRLHIRGGRPGEVAYWVDGVSATDLYDGRIGVAVENSAIQELQVISGTFNAEYGQAMSGIVNIITKQGGKNYTGEVKLYAGDYVSNDDKYSLYKNLVTERDPNTGLTRVASGEKEQPLQRFNPIYNGELSLSGPVPFLGNDLTFFINGRYFYDRGYFYGRNWYRPIGTPGDGSLVAMNPFESKTLHGKLNYQVTSGVKAGFNVFWNDSKRERNYFRAGSVDYNFNPSGQANFQQFSVHDYKYNPHGLPQFHGNGLTLTGTLNHVLSPSTFYELRVSRYHSESKQFVYEDPTAAVKYLASVREDSAKGIAAEVFDPFTQEGQAHLQDVIARGGLFDYVPDPNGPDGYLEPESIDPPTSYSFMNKGMDVTHTERSSAYWVGKFDLTSQITKTHQLKFGSEVRLHDLSLYSFQIVPATDANGQPITPFKPAIPEKGSVYRHDYDREPREISAYVQDKAEFNDIIFNIGLRYDYFHANSNIPTDPTDPNIYSPFKNENIYRDLNGDGNIGIDEQVESNKYTPDERRAFMQKKVKAKTALSPRLGIAFPITDRGVIHFSYGHFFQIPEFQYLYANPDFKVTSGSGTAIFGNPDLKPQKTVMYEIGLQQQLTDVIGIDLTLFYRDVRDWVGTSRIFSTAKTGVAYSMFENKDYSNVRGITLKVEKRLAGNYSFRADYTFQSAEGTYSNPQDEYNAALANRSPVLALLPMNWDQRHTFNAQLIYDVANWTFSLIGRYWSGRPYTPSFPVSETVGASAVTGLTTNSARRPAQKGIDLTINRSFRFGTHRCLDFFVYVYNLLDQRDATVVYTDTGSPEYTTTIDPSKIPYNSARVSTVEDYINQPAWYTAPRQVQVGLAWGF
ncbi:MAG: TonB-dependent receptor [candidate division KSB1 bacterium]|nr:TonB-dependent receptor [candidate division KSB1 bacterium]